MTARKIQEIGLGILSGFSLSDSKDRHKEGGEYVGQASKREIMNGSRAKRNFWHA